MSNNRNIDTQIKNFRVHCETTRENLNSEGQTDSTPVNKANFTWTTYG